VNDIVGAKKTGPNEGRLVDLKTGETTGEVLGWPIIKQIAKVANTCYKEGYAAGLEYSRTYHSIDSD